MELKSRHDSHQAPWGGVGLRADVANSGEEPSQHLDDDLRWFKQVMETGRVLRDHVRLVEVVEARILEGVDGVHQGP